MARAASGVSQAISVYMRRPKARRSIRRLRRSVRAIFSLLEAMGGVAIAVVSSRQWKRRQPGFATDDPGLVGRRQLVGGIQGAQVHFDLVAGAPEDGRAAAGT